MDRFNTEAFSQFVLENQVYGFFEQPVTLKSGRKSHLYANWRNVVEDVWRTEHLAQFVMAFVRDNRIDVDTFYGVPEGATKLGLITQYLWARQQPDYASGSHALAMGRAKPKDHGAPKDRLFVGPPRGQVVVLEDVTTTGGSLLASVDLLREAGMAVSALISLTNRMEKRDDGLTVAQAAEHKGVRFYQMSSALDLLPIVYRRLAPPAWVGRALEEEYARYGAGPLRLL